MPPSRKQCHRAACPPGSPCRPLGLGCSPRSWGDPVPPRVLQPWEGAADGAGGQRATLPRGRGHGAGGSAGLVGAASLAPRHTETHPASDASTARSSAQPLWDRQTCRFPDLPQESTETQPGLTHRDRWVLSVTARKPELQPPGSWSICLERTLRLSIFLRGRSAVCPVGTRSVGDSKRSRALARCRVHRR